MPPGYNNRGARGAPNRSQRGSGQSSGRGASSSSSKSWKKFSSIPTGLEAMQDRTNVLQVGAKEFHNHTKISKKNQNSKKKTVNPSGPNHSNPFEAERQENAAKRAQRGQGAPVGGRENWQAKQARPQSTQDHSTSSFKRPQSIASANPFAPLAPSTSSQSATSNPFAAPLISNAPATSLQANAFQSASSSGLSGSFGVPTNTATNGLSSQNHSIIFGTSPLAGLKPTPIFGSPNTSGQTVFQAKQNPFGAASNNPFGQKSTSPAPNNPFGSFGGAGGGAPTSFGSPAYSAPLSNSLNGLSTFSGGSHSRLGGAPITGAFGQVGGSQSVSILKPSPESLAARIAQQLRKDNVIPPSLASLKDGGSTNQKNKAHDLWGKFQDYRAKARKSLMSANLLDDPEKPKKLKDAIAFKGICEDMCPEFEVVTRIMDGRVDSREKDMLPDGSLSANLNPARMVKALARSAAGQDAPLPSDVRSAAALRRTVDHLFNTILSENSLEAVHGFLWDRTRAVRRDFVFHSSMSPSELIDQVYCLEHITRFHAIALHQMSREGIHADGFVEQQEREQLSKSLLSLMHAYEDCKAQGVSCENEIEFKSYYVLFNGEQPDILEVVQNWGWKYWGESEEIKTAVSLAESIQNNWDVHGPLTPLSTTEIGQNAYSRFFAIVEDAKVSYTMACFAEIYFAKVRKAILKTILASYRKQRDQTKDWTPARLNTYLRFDTEEEVEPFVLLYGLRFDESDGVKSLSFDLNEFRDPHPPPKQPHSYHFVERKRGNYSLTETINRTVYDEAIIEKLTDEEDENDLFVRDDSATPLPPPTLFSTDTEEDIPNDQIGGGNVVVSQTDGTRSVQNPANPVSLLDRPGPPKTFPSGFFSSPTESINKEPPKQTDSASQFGFMKPSAASSPSIFNNPPSGMSSVQNSRPSLAAQRSEAPKEIIAPSGTFAFLNAPTAPSGTTSAIKFPIQNTATTLLETPKVPPPFSNPTTDPSFPFSSPISQTIPAPPISSPQEPAVINPPVLISQPTLTSGQLAEASIATQQVVSSTLSPKSNINFQNTPPAIIPEAPHPNNRTLRFDKLTDWIVNGDDGLLEHFTSFQTESILRQTFAGFVWEKRIQAEQEADKLACKEADEFRYRSLATKWGHRWRRQAQQLWQKRRGREARKLRQEMAENRRASKAAESATIIDDFRASTTARRRDSLESLLGATGVLDGVHDSGTEIRAVVHEGGPAHKRRRSESTQTSSTSRHKRGKSDNPLRRSLMSDPSYLTGGSRIHLMSNYGIQDENRQQVSGVKTDYFRLKARGITTLPGGTPLANTAAMDFLHSKRSFDGVKKPTTTSQTAVSSTSKADLPPVPRFWDTVNRIENEADIQALKLRAKAIMSEDKNRQKRTYVDDDKELFERAKRLREQMDEGARWFRKEVERDTASRSVS